MIFVKVMVSVFLINWAPVVVSIHGSISRFTATLSSEKIDAPLHIHVMSEIRVSNYQLAHTLL